MVRTLLSARVHDVLTDIIMNKTNDQLESYSYFTLK